MKTNYCYKVKAETLEMDDFICHPTCKELQLQTIYWGNLASSHFTHLKCNCLAEFDRLTNERTNLLAQIGKED